MEPSINFSKAVGKLFYAIAAIDKKIHLQEYDSITKLIGKYPCHSKDGGENSLEIIKSFYQYVLEKANAYNAFKEFESFKRAHEEEFTPRMKKWIWETADRISYSFCNKNKSEVIMLSKLKSALQEGSVEI